MAINTPFITSTQVASSTPFDPTTGDGFIGTDVQSALQELRNYTVYDSDITATTASGTLTLLPPIAGGQVNGATSQRLQILTGSATGYTVKMPSALTLSISAEYLIANTSSRPVTIEDGGGNVLFTLSQSSIGTMILQAAGSAAGTWLWWQTSLNVAAGIIVYNITSTTAFATSASAMTLITGMSVVPQAGTYSIWFNSSITGSGSAQAMDVQIQNGATVITDSPREAATPAGSHVTILGTQTTAQFNGTSACAAYVNANGNSMTVNQRSLLMIRTGT
jgi:hypothetical protein